MVEKNPKQLSLLEELIVILENPTKLVNAKRFELLERAYLERNGNKKPKKGLSHNEAITFAKEVERLSFIESKGLDVGEMSVKSYVNNFLEKL